MQDDAARYQEKNVTKNNARYNPNQEAALPCPPTTDASSPCSLPVPLPECRVRKHSVDVGDAAVPPSSSSSPLEFDENDDRGLASSLFRLRVHCTCAPSFDGSADVGERDGIVWLLRSLGRMLWTKLAGLEEDKSFLEERDLENMVLAAPLLV